MEDFNGRDTRDRIEREDEDNNQTEGTNAGGFEGSRQPKRDKGLTTPTKIAIAIGIVILLSLLYIA